MERDRVFNKHSIEHQKILRTTLDRVRSLFSGDEDDEVVFTTSKEEAFATVMYSVYMNEMHALGKNHVVLSSQGESFEKVICSQYEKVGVVYDEIPVDSAGKITVEAVQQYVQLRTILISIPWSHPLTHVINPIWEIAEFCKKKDIMLHVDMSGAVTGSSYFTLASMQLPFVTFDCGVCNAPFLSLLIIKPGIELVPLIPGSDATSLRGGKLDVNQLIHLSQGIDDRLENTHHYLIDVCQYVSEFKKDLAIAVPSCEFLLSHSDILPSFVVFAIPGVYCETVVNALDSSKIECRAKDGKDQSLFLMLQGCGVDNELSLCAVSCSFQQCTSLSDVKECIDAIQSILEKPLRIIHGHDEK